jgi:RNA-directed DNA polymerase
MSGSSSPGSVSTRLLRIAELARTSPAMVLTTLAHHIDGEWLLEAWRATRKDAAPGVDGVTAEEYEKHVFENLGRLLDRLKTGSYKAPPVRRVDIPKASGGTRPIGIPTLEDKVLQRAVAMVLEAVYEQEFLDCSFGFRPGRSAHHALERLWKGLMEMGGGWVIDLDIERFFDSLDHGKLRGILDTRIRDGVIRRTIDKWLAAGVMVEGQVSRAVSGTPQGGVISPILANVYLHHVLDTWFEQEVKPRLRGRAFLVRYADDVVLVCADEHDARRVLDVLPRRLGRFGLRMHPEKTRLLRFRRPPRDGGMRGDHSPRPGTFDFLGFTHYWGMSRKGSWVVKRKTARGRLRRALAYVNRWCSRHRHFPMIEQHRYLRRLILGHCQYYGITGNSYAIGQFRQRLQRLWRYWLSRRSQKGKMTWSRFRRLSQRYPLPRALAVHSTCRA